MAPAVIAAVAPGLVSILGEKLKADRELMQRVGAQLVSWVGDATEAKTVDLLWMSDTAGDICIYNKTDFMYAVSSWRRQGCHKGFIYTATCDWLAADRCQVWTNVCPNGGSNYDSMIYDKLFFFTDKHGWIDAKINVAALKKVIKEN